MMEISKFALGYREFWPEREILAFIRESKHFDASREDSKKASGLLIFQTRSQQTWLVATTLRLYVILDDRRKQLPTVIRSLAKERLLKDDGSLALGLGERERSRNTGVLLMESYKGLLFSYKLFPDTLITDSVAQLIRRVMT